MKTENNILEKIGNKNPYKVPENYFEDFADNMDKILDSMPLPEGMESVVEAPAATTETKPMVEAEAKEVSEDEIKQLEDELQKLTDKFVKEIDKLVDEKSKEIMTV